MWVSRTAGNLPHRRSHTVDRTDLLSADAQPFTDASRSSCQTAIVVKSPAKKNGRGADLSGRTAFQVPELETKEVHRTAMAYFDVSLTKAYRKRQRKVSIFSSGIPLTPVSTTSEQPSGETDGSTIVATSGTTADITVATPGTPIAITVPHPGTTADITRTDQENPSRLTDSSSAVTSGLSPSSSSENGMSSLVISEGFSLSSSDSGTPGEVINVTTTRYNESPSSSPVRTLSSDGSSSNVSKPVSSSSSSAHIVPSETAASFLNYQKSTGFPSGAIAGVGIGSFLVLSLLCGLLFWRFRRLRRSLLAKSRAIQTFEKPELPGIGTSRTAHRVEADSDAAVYEMSSTRDQVMELPGRTSDTSGERRIIHELAS